MNDLTYCVDTQSRTVTCTVHNCKRDFKRITKKILAQYPEDMCNFYEFMSVYYCEKLVHDEYTGKAVCGTTDVFNVKYGKDIARTKAIVKREEAFHCALEAIYDAIDTLKEINCSINRDHVLFRHLDNFTELIEQQKPLSVIRHHENEDEFGIADNIDLNKEYTPHVCALCNHSFLNYYDDKEYESNENQWTAISMPNGQLVEICPTCAETVQKLSAK